MQTEQPPLGVGVIVFAACRRKEQSPGTVGTPETMRPTRKLFNRSRTRLKLRHHSVVPHPTTRTSEMVGYGV